MKTPNAAPRVWSTIQATARSISRRRFLGSLGIGGAAALFAPWGATAFARMSPRTLATLDAGAGRAGRRIYPATAALRLQRA